MIRAIRDSINDYSNALIQANAVFKQAESYMKENYKEGSDLYKSAMKMAQEVRETATRPILDDCKASMNEIFTGVRDRIKSVVAVAPSADVLGVVPMISNGKLTDTEIQIFLDKHNNYMDKKLIYTAMGKGEYFTTVEHVLDELDDLQARVSYYFETYHGEPLERISYKNAVLLNGSLVEDISEMVNNFLNTYGE